MSGRPKLKFEATEYSVEIQVLFRENRRIVYREQRHVINVDAEVVGPKWNQLNAMMPAGVARAEAERIAQNLADALSHLGYEYMIYERGQNENVPEGERVEARDRLRGLGLEANVLPGGQVNLKRISQVEDRKFAPSVGIDMMKWVSDVRGVRSTLRLLAKSRAAL